MAGKFSWDDHPVIDGSKPASPKAPAQSAAQGFSWDDHPVIGQAPAQESWGKQLARSTIDTIPYATGIGAGILAAPETGPGAIAVGAAGYAGGKSLANYLKAQFLGDDPEAKTVGELAKQTVGNLAEGATIEAGGQILSAAPGLVKSGVESGKNFVAEKLGQNLRYTPSANADQVVAAAEKLGIKNVPKAVLTDNPNFQKLESGLAQSGSLPARATKENYNKFFNDLDAAKSQISNLKSADSDYSLGQNIQKNLSEKVAGNQKPVAELYDGIHKDLKNIPVNSQIVNRVVGGLKRNPLFQTKEGMEFLADHKNVILQQPELASLKELRTMYGKMLESGDSTEAARANEFYKALTDIRNGSIEATKANLPKSAHPAIDQLADQITLADTAHSANIDDVNKIKGVVTNRDVKSTSQFLGKLSDAEAAQVAQRSANLDIDSMKHLQKNYPQVFQQAKQAKLNDLIQSSTHSVNGFNDTAFMKKYDSLEPEIKNMLFDKPTQEKIQALRTIKQNIPDKLGPSGTPEGLMHMDMFSPKRNALDLGIKMTLNHAEKTATPAISKAAEAGPSKVTPLLRLINGGADSAPAPAMSLPKAAQQSQPLKGEDKWADDGMSKVQDHLDDSSDDGLDSIIFDDKEAMLSNPKVKNLLAQASDLKPGSKAMANIVSKIKSQLGKANA